MASEVGVRNHRWVQQRGIGVELRWNIAMGIYVPQYHRLDANLLPVVFRVRGFHGVRIHYRQTMYILKDSDLVSPTLSGTYASAEKSP